MKVKLIVSEVPLLLGVAVVYRHKHGGHSEGIKQ
jgi:hypothetical protein